MPGREGVLHLQLNTLADGAKGTPIKTVSVNISGKLNIETEGQGVYAWWNMGIYQMVEGDGDGTDPFKSFEVIATGSLSTRESLGALDVGERPFARLFFIVITPLL
ncbi:hypothetical protein FOZ63_020553 [Perkinsus olseni]|uniref:Uncharacterized protein n=1 Tax=Perkinsus olseni TaxID=32597 RepID=A0A7J6SSL7_PEROL|nr:hypothetical protein FOZ63_020553 [Perkinsus olseni]KAF4735747.1 hypothetical protein FOZ62_023896 [Perkinsus olseni]